MFKHNICGDLPAVLDGIPDASVPLPPEFFANPRCPLVLATIEDTTVESHLSKAVQEPKDNTLIEDQS